MASVPSVGYAVYDVQASSGNTGARLKPARL